MMQRETVRKIADLYPWSSWAIWDDAFPDGECIETNSCSLVEFMLTHHKKLTSDVVLLGLNRSDDLPGPFANFHAPTRKHFDYRLKETIQDGGLDRLPCAYMTDLVDEIDSESHHIEETPDDAALLLEQLDLLGGRSFEVICFGNKPFQGLVDYFNLAVEEGPHEILLATVKVGAKRLNIYRVWFYGLYGANQQKVPVFKAQLQYLHRHLD